MEEAGPEGFKMLVGGDSGASFSLPQSPSGKPVIGQDILAVVLLHTHHSSEHLKPKLRHSLSKIKDLQLLCTQTVMRYGSQKVLT